MPCLVLIKFWLTKLKTQWMVFVKKISVIAEKFCAKIYVYMCAAHFHLFKQF